MSALLEVVERVAILPILKGAVGCHDSGHVFDVQGNRDTEVYRCHIEGAYAISCGNNESAAEGDKVVRASTIHFFEVGLCVIGGIGGDGNSKSNESQNNEPHV